MGYSRNPSSPGITLAMHYDGSSWQLVNTPNPPGSFSSVLYSVAVVNPRSALAVGTYQDPSTLEERSLAMRWNGAVWSLLRVPAVPGCTSRATLHDAATVSGSVFVVGTCRTTEGADGGFALSLSSAGWQVQVHPGDGLLPAPSDLRSVSLVPGSGVWAVGFSSAAQTVIGLSIRFDGRRWTSLDVPKVGTTTELLGVSGRSPSDIWAVGITATGAFAERLSLHWDGGSWVQVPAGDYSTLYGVAYDPAGSYWSVGHDLGDSVLQRIAAG